MHLRVCCSSLLHHLWLISYAVLAPACFWRAANRICRAATGPPASSTCTRGQQRKVSACSQSQKPDPGLCSSLAQGLQRCVAPAEHWQAPAPSTLVMGVLKASQGSALLLESLCGFLVMLRSRTRLESASRRAWAFWSAGLQGLESLCLLSGSRNSAPHSTIACSKWCKAPARRIVQ